MTPRDMAPTAGFNATRGDRQVRSALWPGLLGGLTGTVVELGPGGGGNLRYFGGGVRWVGVEPDAGARERVRREAARLGREVEVLAGRAEALELGDAAVDAVVCSLVLCSVRDQARALAEVWRVLRPGGRFVFTEHVIAPRRTWVRFAQNVLGLLPTRCRPNRDTEKAIADAGFTLVDLHRFDRPGPWDVGVPHITGCCVKGQS